MLKIKQDKKLKKAADHVKYEINMFRAATSQLYYFEQMVHKGRKTNQLLINVFLESFGIHSYNLFKFFYAGKNKRDTDIIAENFDIRREFFKSNRTPKKKLKNIENRRNKEIAHLTYNRIYRNKRTKPWNFGLISKDMEQTIKAFIDSLPETNIIHYLIIFKYIKYYIKSS